MRVRVLGSAAGGGFPQWNCGCPNCHGVRSGRLAAVPRTEDTVAVSADGGSWLLLNASGDLRRQLEATPALHPHGPRDVPLAGVVLTNGEIDHVAGLLALRQSQPLVVWATGRVREGFVDANAMARALAHVPGQTTWRALSFDADAAAGALAVRPVPAPGRVAPHLADRFPPAPEDNVGLLVHDRGDGTTLAYFPGVAALTPGVRAALEAADVVLFDGTFWAHDEMPALGLGTRRADAMGHLPVGGPDGSLARLHGLPARRRVYTHLNNTNPLLREDAPERAALAAAGWEVARDGMELGP